MKQPLLSLLAAFILLATAPARAKLVVMVDPGKAGELGPVIDHDSDLVHVLFRDAMATSAMRGELLKTGQAGRNTISTLDGKYTPFVSSEHSNLGILERPFGKICSAERSHRYRTRGGPVLRQIFRNAECAGATDARTDARGASGHPFTAPGVF